MIWKVMFCDAGTHFPSRPSGHIFLQGVDPFWAIRVNGEIFSIFCYENKKRSKLILVLDKSQESAVRHS